MLESLKSIFGGMRIAGTGLRAERTRMDTIARNVANSQTTRMPGTSDPYRRQVVNFAPILERLQNGKTEVAGVEVQGIEGDYRAPFEEIFDPSHPDADAQGVVRMPNVNSMAEMADLITAVRAYEANLTVQQSFERMAESALRLAE